MCGTSRPGGMGSRHEGQCGPPPGSLRALMGVQNTGARVHLRERRSIQPARGEGAAMGAMDIMVGAFRAGWTLCL